MWRESAREEHMYGLNLENKGKLRNAQCEMTIYYGDKS